MPAVTPMNTRWLIDKCRTQSHVQTDACPERVTEHAARAPHRERRAPPPLTRPPAAGRSARTSSEPACPGRSTATTLNSVLELFAEVTPESARLGEAVQHHEWPARAADLDMEWHVG